MDALVAVISKHDHNAISILMLMLRELLHRGNRSHKVITPDATISAESFKELDEHLGSSSSVAIGHNSTFLDKGSPSPNDLCMAFEGWIFNESASSYPPQATTTERSPPEEIAEGLIRKFDGAYAFALVSAGQVAVGRDRLGAKPLYYGEDRQSCAVASERKALWNVGIQNTRPFPPGHLAIMSLKGFLFRHVWTIKLRPPRKIRMQSAVRRLRILLEECVKERLHDVQNAGVAFSGGLDSSMVARLAQETESTLHLISVGMDGCPELSHATKAAKALGPPITVREYCIGDVEKTLFKVLWLIEEPDPMKASIAIPLFWSAQSARRLGCGFLLAGQGADEMFGGYRRYLAIYEKRGVDGVAESLFYDTTMSYMMNLQRDEPLCAFNDIELRLPFIDTKLARFALSLPVDLKIESAGDPLRKRILRQLAKDLGIPTFIAGRPKKAIQFETGVDKALRGLAGSKGFTLRGYIEEVYKTVRSRSESDLN